MTIRLYIAGGVFDLDARYGAEQLARDFDADDAPAVMQLDLQHGGMLQLHVTHRSEWAMTEQADEISTPPTLEGRRRHRR